MNIKRFWWMLGSGASTTVSWSNGIELTANTEETIQFVRLTKAAGMKDDFSDVRFIIDPEGSGQQKLFLPYELLTSDATYLYYKVAHLSYFSNPSATFYAIWGNPTATYEGNPQRVALTGAWVTNNFNRGANYDVANVFANWDYILDGPGDASIEANWPCCAQMPTLQTSWGKPSANDYNKVYIGYKYDADDNIHAGSPTSKSAIKYSLDFGETWSDRQYIYDPDEGYRGTSTTSVAIPTSGSTEVTLTTQAGLGYQIGEIARIYYDETHWVWVTVTEYTGTTFKGTRLANTGSGTFASWVISQKYGATNTVITSVKKPDGVVRLVAAFSKINFYETEGVSSNIARVFASYTDLDSNGDIVNPWSEPVMISDDNWSNVGGKATTTYDGIVWMTYHQDKITTATYSSNVAYSRDYGVTWGNLKVDSPGLTYLNETDLLPLYDDSFLPTNTIRATCRNETAPSHQYYYEITWDDSIVSASVPIENDWYDSTVSRYTSVRCPDINTVFWAGGDATEKIVYSPDNLRTYYPIPFATLYTSAVSARRVYTVMAVHPDGRMLKIWASNKQPNGSDLFVNYFDWTLNNLYCDTFNTLTNGAGTHNRPRDLNPGIRIGEFLQGYRTSSTTSISVPSGSGQQRTLTVATGLNWAPSDIGCCVATANNAIRFTFTCVSYNPSTGELVVEWLTNNTTSTQASWKINLGNVDNVGNLLANQAYYTIPRRIGNGQIRPYKVTLNVGSFGTGLVTGGFWGVKRFETRAMAVVTITNAGDEGDVITIRWKKSDTYTGLFGGMGPLATYTVRNGDDIADVVAGLVASANELGVSPAPVSDATTLTMMAPFGNNTAINGQALTVEVTGNVAGSSGNFSGGTAIEAGSALQNVFTVDNANNITRIEQANDNYNTAFTVNDGPVDYEFQISAINDTVTDGTTTKTKTSDDGSGLLNFEAHLELFLTTSVSSNWGIIDLFGMKAEPQDQTIPTEGTPVSGTWTERTDGRGLN